MPVKRGFDGEEIVAMYQNGMTQRDIAEALGASTTTINYHINKAEKALGKAITNILAAQWHPESRRLSTL